MPKNIEASQPSQEQNQTEREIIAPVTEEETGKVRNFSKEHSSAERLEKAKEIRALRKEYFSEKGDIGRKMEG